jgi:hypothetical protein
MNMDVGYRVYRSGCRAFKNRRPTAIGSVNRQPGKDRHDL